MFENKNVSSGGFLTTPEEFAVKNKEREMSDLGQCQGLLE